MMKHGLTIYIASSFSNFHAVRLLTDRLSNEGHTVLDWTRKAPPLPPGMPVDERRAMLDADERGEIFRFCSEACACADLLVYLGPAGQDAACEVGMAWVSGIPVYGLRGRLEAPGLILGRAVSRWFDDADDLMNALPNLQNVE